MKRALVLVDAAHIQSYIFGSNRLQENIGASYLVARATGEWALDLLPKPNNVRSAPDGLLEDGVTLDSGDSAINAEVISTGGGNLAVLLRDPDEAVRFTEALSRKILLEAPGLEAIIEHRTFDWENDSLYEVHQAALRAMEGQRRSPAPSIDLLGLGVTASCQSTGRPACTVKDLDHSEEVEGERRSSAYRASSEVVAKLDSAKPANDHLGRNFDPGSRYRFPYQLDLLGRAHGEASYVAVVHADGNGVGSRLRDLGKALRASHQNRAYVNQIRTFSMGLNGAATGALHDTLDQLIPAINAEEACIPGIATVPDLHLVRTRGGGHFLPFRPLVYGGDDVTFVCDGRLGLSLARTFLQQFALRAEDLLGGPLTAGAGVAVVKVHYPFARAYALSAQLCGAAKAYGRGLGGNLTVMDWHLAPAGPTGSLEDVRRREYQNGALLVRPFTLGPNPRDAVRTWHTLEEGMAAFQRPQPQETKSWMERRNKIKTLRDALRKGPGDVQRFVELFNDGHSLPPVGRASDEARRTGWEGDTCVYFDAIEAADLFLPLEHRAAGGGAAHAAE